jgi:hypothetical protein
MSTPAAPNAGKARGATVTSTKSVAASVGSLDLGPVQFSFGAGKVLPVVEFTVVHFSSGQGLGKLYFHWVVLKLPTRTRYELWKYLCSYIRPYGCSIIFCRGLSRSL